MKAVSLFAGVGGIDLAFERAGIETVLQAERDKWCLSVLARHWPDVERVSDVARVQPGAVADLPRRVGGVMEGRHDPRRGDGTDAAEGQASGVDLVYGGFPCQPFSVAGARRGAADERDGWPEFRRVVSELRPRWVVAENVPGLLSIDGGRYFGQIIRDLDELGFDVAWAVLDAQHFGVPQRRRRVFIVGGPRGRGPEQVLHLCEGCDGDIAAGGEAGEAVAGTLGGGAGSRGWSPDTDRMTFIASAISASAGHHGHSSPRGDGSDNLIAATLRGRSHGEGVNMPGRGGEEAYGDNLIPDIVGALSDGAHHGGGLNGQDAYTGRIFPTSTGVRRLTPRECERLQGFPDDWTRWGVDGKEITDSHRYRMCGNAVAVPVLEWVGRRLVAVDEVMA